MYCPSCGRFFPGEGATCELCGAAIPGVPSRAAVPRFDSVSLTFSVQPNCRFCAAQIDGGADTCPACGQSQSAAVEFVGFWRRFAAYLLDQFVIFAIYFGLALFSMVAVLVVASATKNDRLRQAIESGNWVSTEVKILLQVCFFLISWVYYARMESSPGQATLGKRWLRIRVVDTEGGRLSFGRASKRFFGKILSGLTLGAGYIMIAFSDRKQGLHDRIADTLVVRR
jgi:uncharacterized RDD family membrane protein YckC